MSTDNDDLPDSELSMATITPEVLAVWQSEIRAFFVTTEQKLSKFRDGCGSCGDSHEKPKPQATAEKIHATPFGSSAAVHQVGAKDDSVDRLQAIKDRLAAQLENASR